MDLFYLLKGFILGFSIAAPVGPIGVLCIRTTLSRGRLAGFVTGMGAATADGFYGFVSAFGLTAVSGLLISGQFWIRLIGGAFLLYLAAKTFMSEPATKPAQTSGKGLWSTYITTVFLTLTNPATILSFAAIFAGLGIGSETGDYLSATLLVLGVFLGSAAWWLLLSGLVSLFRSRFNLTAMRWVNRLSGVVLLGFSVYALVGIF